MSTPWDWAPVADWLGLPPGSPHRAALLLTAPRAAGCSCAAAAAAAGLGDAIHALHFCRPADARRGSALEVLRSVAFQLACRFPRYGQALCKALLEQGSALPDPGADDASLEDAVEALLRAPLEQARTWGGRGGEGTHLWGKLHHAEGRLHRVCFGVGPASEGHTGSSRPIATTSTARRSNCLSPWMGPWCGGGRRRLGSRATRPAAWSSSSTACTTRANPAPGLMATRSVGVCVPAGGRAVHTMYGQELHHAHSSAATALGRCPTCANALHYCRSPLPGSTVSAAVHTCWPGRPHTHTSAPPNGGLASSACQVLRLVVDHLARTRGLRLVLTASSDQRDAHVAAALHHALLAPARLSLAQVRLDGAGAAGLACAFGAPLRGLVHNSRVTGQELLWQARGDMGHARLLRLLVQHAAERQLEAALALGSSSSSSSSGTIGSFLSGGSMPMPAASGPGSNLPSGAGLGSGVYYSAASNAFADDTPASAACGGEPSSGGRDVGGAGGGRQAEEEAQEEAMRLHDVPQLCHSTPEEDYASLWLARCSSASSGGGVGGAEHPGPCLSAAERCALGRLLDALSVAREPLEVGAQCVG